MIRCIVHTITSKRDLNGNRYHLAIFYNPAKGRHDMVKMEVGGESNAIHLAYMITGDYEAILSFESTEPKQRWQSLRRSSTWLYEGSQEATAAINALFDIGGAK